MEPSLIQKYFKSGDNVTLSLKNEEKFLGEIMEITNTHLGLSGDYSTSVISLDQIVHINKDFVDNMQSKNNENEHSTNSSFYQQELIITSAEQHLRDTDISNLAVQFHLLGDLQDLKEFYERNESFINSSEHLTRLYQEKLEEFD